jgi:hypothetical protein
MTFLLGFALPSTIKYFLLRSGSNPNPNSGKILISGHLFSSSYVWLSVFKNKNKNKNLGANYRQISIFLKGQLPL